jgi:phenol hydroxylase P3 protein
VNVKEKRSALLEQYSLMKRSLDWEFSYVDHQDVYPQATYEGINIEDWDKWKDPFCSTVDRYWKYQADRETRRNAVVDAFSSNNGYLNITDARYLNALEIFLSVFSTMEYHIHRGFARLARQLPGIDAQIAFQIKALEEIRHCQAQLHLLSNDGRLYDGFQDSPNSNAQFWCLSIAKSYVEDACTSGPFEFIIAIGLGFDYLITNLFLVPFVSGVALNGEINTMTIGFNKQPHDARRNIWGLEIINYLLEQDPDNIVMIQKWIDKWVWRSARLLSLAAMIQDYMVPKREMCWKQVWEIQVEENGMAVFNSLSKYGVKVPVCIKQLNGEKAHISHQMWSAYYSIAPMNKCHALLPDKDELDWLTSKYPQTFEKYYRPRFDFWR